MTSYTVAKAYEGSRNGTGKIAAVSFTADGKLVTADLVRVVSSGRVVVGLDAPIVVDPDYFSLCKPKPIWIISRRRGWCSGPYSNRDDRRIDLAFTEEEVSEYEERNEEFNRESDRLHNGWRYEIMQITKTSDEFLT